MHHAKGDLQKMSTIFLKIHSKITVGLKYALLRIACSLTIKSKFSRTLLIAFVKCNIRQIIYLML